MTNGDNTRCVCMTQRRLDGEIESDDDIDEDDDDIDENEDDDDDEDEDDDEDVETWQVSDSGASR